MSGYMSYRFGPSSDLTRMTVYLLVGALGLALLHHIDHALRVDHSGWPFRDHVTPYTYSLAAFPIVLFALFGPLRLFWVRWLLVAIAAASTIYAHTMIENPNTQFHMWAHNQSIHDIDVHNALNLQSMPLGVVSVVVGMALNVTVVAAAMSMLWNGLSKDTKNASPRPTREP